MCPMENLLSFSMKVISTSMPEKTHRVTIPIVDKIVIISSQKRNS